MKVYFLAILLIIAGCSTRSGVVPIGSNTYMIENQKNVSLNGLGDLKVQTLREANEYCTSLGKTFELVDSYQSKPPHIFGNFPRVEVTFKCIDEITDTNK